MKTNKIRIQDIKCVYNDEICDCCFNNKHPQPEERYLCCRDYLIIVPPYAKNKSEFNGIVYFEESDNSCSVNYKANCLECSIYYETCVFRTSYNNTISE
jgi:hypothetical protein